MAKDNPVEVLLAGNEQILEDTRDNILEQYRNLGLYASGFFASNIRIDFNSLSIPAYGLYLADGVGVRVFPPIEPIETWLRQKGIQARDYQTGRFIRRRQAAFAIAKKIGTQGTDIYLRRRRGLDYDAAINKAVEDNFNDIANDIIRTFDN